MKDLSGLVRRKLSKKQERKLLVGKASDECVCDLEYENYYEFQHQEGTAPIGIVKIPKMSYFHELLDGFDEYDVRLCGICGKRYDDVPLIA